MSLLQVFRRRNTDFEDFEKNELGTDLRRKSLGGAGITVGAQGIKFFLTLISTAILARLLLPEEFGVVEKISTVTAFFVLFRDLGLTTATVQTKTLDQSTSSTMFWLNILMGVTLTGVTALLATPLALFYEDPRVFHITLVLSLTFILGAAAGQHQALLQRRMMFGALSLCEVFGMAGGFVIAVITALNGASYWSLVYMLLGNNICYMVGVWWFSAWIPGRPVWSKQVSEMLRFGSALTGTSILNYLAHRSSDVLLGKFHGDTALGLYGRAYKLLLFPINQFSSPLTSVALPTLSRLSQDPPKFRRYYRKAIFFIAFVAMPSVIYLLVASREVILIFLGNQWVGAIPIFIALGPAAIVNSYTVAYRWVFVSTGQTTRQFKWMSRVYSPTVIIAIIIGTYWGALGVACAYSLACITLLIPTLKCAYKESPVSLSDFLRTADLPLLSSIAAGASVYITREVCNLPESSLFLNLIVTWFMFVGFYLFFLSLPRRGAQRVRATIEMGRELMGIYLPVIFKK